MMRLQSFALGEWVTGSGTGTPLHDAVTGEEIAMASSEGLDFAAMLEHGRATGGPALRRLTFHQRARMLKALALHLSERKEEFYRVSAFSGATRGDSWIDIDGGIGTLFAYASRGRREFPDETYYVDGGPEALSKGDTFIGRHICVPLEGVAVQINAFNFPVWGMLEKLATSFLAGMPSIEKFSESASWLKRTLCSRTARPLLSIRPVDADPVNATESCEPTWSSRSPALPQISWKVPAGSSADSTIALATTSVR